MNDSMFILSFLTFACILVVVVGFVMEKSILKAIGGVLLLLTVYFGWLIYGLTVNEKITYEKIDKKNLEIFVSKSKIIVIDNGTNYSNNFYMIESYDRIVNQHDSTFYIRSAYDMYGNRRSHYMTMDKK